MCVRASRTCLCKGHDDINMIQEQSGGDVEYKGREKVRHGSAVSRRKQDNGRTVERAERTCSSFLPSIHGEHSAVIGLDRRKLATKLKAS